MFNYLAKLAGCSVNLVVFYSYFLRIGITILTFHCSGMSSVFMMLNSFSYYLYSCMLPYFMPSFSSEYNLFVYFCLELFITLHFLIALYAFFLCNFKLLLFNKHSFETRISYAQYFNKCVLFQYFLLSQFCFYGVWLQNSNTVLY